MKRLLHALAALWPLPTRRSPCGFAEGPLPADAIPCGFADSPIREFAKSNTTKLQQAIPQNHKKAKPNFFTRGKTSLNCRFSLVFTITILFMCLTAARQVSAQAEPADAAIQPLQIGDKIPEELWNLPLQVVNHPEGKETITLNDYRGKLIILDFWATWCTSCIKSFPKISEYSQQYADSLTILMINSKSNREADMGRVKTVLETHSDGTLYSVVNDEALKSHFPMHVLPYNIWIDHNGTVRAVAFQEYLNVSNIENAILRINNLKARRQRWKRN